MSLASARVTEAGSLIFVDVHATGPVHDGTTWCTAYQDLQDALAAARAGGMTTEIRVAGGVYFPDQGTNQAQGDRTATFALISGVIIRGGFAGCGEPDPDERDLVANETILSGDLSGNDDSPMVSNCCTTNATQSCDDAACETSVCNERASCCNTDWDATCALIAAHLCCGVCGDRCENAHHVVTASGTDATTVLDGFTITAGRADDSGALPAGTGGGMLNNAGSPTVRKCTFERNSARAGGGLINLNANPSLTGCTFSDNAAITGGGSGTGGGMLDSSSTTDLIDCRFSNNYAPSMGGGLRAANSSTTLTRCSFTQNMAGAIWLEGSSIMTLYDSTFRGNASDFGGAISGVLGNLTINHCRFTRNTAVNGGGAVALQFTVAQILSSEFTGNVASDGGAVWYSSASLFPFWVRNSVFYNNSALNSGGALWLSDMDAILSNCTVANNSAPSGPALALKFVDLDSMQISNCVFWDGGEEIFQEGSGGSLVIRHSDVEGGALGTGNINETPNFVDAVGGDLRLMSGSPCIDAGDNVSVPPDLVADFDGHPRFVDDPNAPDCPQPGANCGTAPIVDMGAFERQLDCNNNGVPDLEDVDPTDPDGDGQVADDCNLNGIPDECEIDAASTATNGPFYCDPAVPPAGLASCDPDCNNNGIPDECEIPQSGIVSSTWVGESGLWDDEPNGNAGWCLPERPSNNPEARFDVTIDSPVSVTLNFSPTVDSMSISNGGMLVVGDASAGGRTLIVEGTPGGPCAPGVDGCIVNTGTFLATDREALTLKAVTIDQIGDCVAGGVLKATDGTFNDPSGPDSAADKSILEISGARVLRGAVETEGANSEIHLIGGAELVDVCVKGNVISGRGGVVVPDGKLGRFGGTVTNNSRITIGGETFTTRLQSAGADSVLTGSGSVLLTNQTNSELGGFKTSLVNAAGHRIEGAGVVFGGLTNEGIIEANSPDGALILFPPGTKTNRGSLRAVDGGTLRIDDALVQEGALAFVEAVDGGTVAVNANVTGDGTLRADNGIVEVNGVSVALAQVDIDQAGQMLVDGDANVVVSGTMTLSGGSVYEAKDPLSGFEAGSLRAGRIIVRADTCRPTATSLHLSQSMSLVSDGNLEIIGLGTFAQTVAGGCDPPGYKATGASSVEVGGDFVLHDFAAAEHTSAKPLILHGAFDIRSIFPGLFAWESGTIRLAGGDSVTLPATPPPQAFEVAGVDLGPNISGFAENFAVDSIEVAAGSHVEFLNAAPNTVSSEPCTEALYVHTLSFRADSQVTLNDCRVYCLFLENEGVSPTMEGCAALVLIPSGDSNGDRAIGLADYRALMGCFTGSGFGSIGEACRTFDFDFDQDVDLLDFAAFQRRFGTQIR